LCSFGRATGILIYFWKSHTPYFQCGRRCIALFNQAFKRLKAEIGSRAAAENQTPQ
jgi:hypothetical protein